jgi:hypothetical protein
MAPPRRNFLFLDVLEREYPLLIRDESDVNKVRCILCKSFFSISHGGRCDIKKHIRARKHKESLDTKASRKKCYSLLLAKTIRDKNSAL